MKNYKLWNEEVKFTQEDELLAKIVEENGSRIWKTVSEILRDKNCIRTPKQCRDRWVNYLKKRTSKRPFTTQESISTIEFYSMFGSQWSKLSDLIPGKTENQIKNFINSIIRRNIRRFNKGKLENERIQSNSIEILKFPEVKNLLLTHVRVKKDWYIDKFLSKDILKEINQIKTQKEKERYGKIDNTEKQVNESPANTENDSSNELSWMNYQINKEHAENLYQMIQSNYYWSNLTLNGFYGFNLYST